MVGENERSFLVAVPVRATMRHYLKLLPEKPEYFSLRAAPEKTYGHTHAVKIGNKI